MLLLKMTCFAGGFKGGLLRGMVREEKGEEGGGRMLVIQLRNTRKVNMSFYNNDKQMQQQQQQQQTATTISGVSCIVS
jgi:hypothetical protein